MTVMPRGARQHHTAWLILALTGLAFALRAGGLTAQSLWRDEVDALRFSTQALPALLEMFRRQGENGPLFFLALRPWLAVAGTSEYALRFPAALAGTLATPVVYALLCRLTVRLSAHDEARQRGAALITAALLATAPYAVWYGQEAKMYAALLLWLPLTIYLTVRASWDGGAWRWLLLYCITSLGFYLHLLAALAVPVQAVWLLLLPALARTRTAGWARRRRLIGLLYLALLLLPYLPFARWQAPLWLAADTQTGYPFVPLPSILLVLWVAFSRGILPVTDPATLLPITLAWLVGIGLWAGLRRRALGEDWLGRRRWIVIGLLLVWLLWPPVGIYIISLRRPLFADRYLIWALPAFLALAGLGLAALARVPGPQARAGWRPLAAALFGIVLALNLTAVAGQMAQPIKSDFRAATRFVLTHRQAGDQLLFQIPYGRYSFVYYGGELAQWLDGPYTNHGMSAAELAAVMTGATAGVSAIWLIATEMPMWDDRGLTEAWLKAHGQTTHRAEFARVAVTRYQLR
jgi:uncharacterized membrane protein